DAERQAAVCLRRISVMTEETSVGRLTAEIAVIRTVVARTHGPMPAPIRVPAYRQLQEMSRFILVQKCLRVSSRTDHIVHSLLNHVCSASLSTAYKVLRASFHDGVISSRRRVKKIVQSRRRFDRSERSSHPGDPVRIEDFLVARPARSRVDV